MNWRIILENWEKYLNSFPEIKNIDIEPGWLKFSFDNKEMSYETRERYVSRVYMPDYYENDRVVIETNPASNNNYKYTYYVGIDRIEILEFYGGEIMDRFLHKNGENYIYSEQRSPSGDHVGYIKSQYPIKFDLDIEEVKKLSRVVMGVFNHINQG